ncbi:hypothetical protein LMG28727_00258 [Paraburkholderia kirstenboschensis]|uniref:hypothetical protein n=1 Tax=Paraburkholderia kirstenboschensis TaxID=1245436 RepID=UPI000A62B6F4|nr:hypothetical protein [Paraburkholderia kirstenboschensis]CAD6509597.1 hypothetical protein LMG28727_00258 [Paraburkholderia kirstenboschensis]
MIAYQSASAHLRNIKLKRQTSGREKWSSLSGLSLFFEQLSRDHPTILQNIEIVNENKIGLDESYHQPTHFILNLNNLLRSLRFFTEFSNLTDAIKLQRLVDIFMSEYRKKKLCTITSTKEDLNKLSPKLMAKIDEMQGTN